MCGRKIKKEVEEEEDKCSRKGEKEREEKGREYRLKA